MGYLNEGSSYLIETFMVAQNDIKYKKTTHKYKLHFMRTTRLSMINDDDIPLFYFDFSDFPVILSENRSELIVGIPLISIKCLLSTDVIGHVVQKDTLKEKEKDGRRSILLEIVLEDIL